MSNNGILVNFYYDKNNLKLYRLEKIEYNGELIYYSPLVNGNYDTSKVGKDWTFIPLRELGVTEADESKFISLISAAIYDTINYETIDKITNYVRDEFEAKQIHKQTYNKESDEEITDLEHTEKNIIRTSCGHNCSGCSACSACSRAFL